MIMGISSSFFWRSNSDSSSAPPPPSSSSSEGNKDPVVNSFFSPPTAATGWDEEEDWDLKEQFHNTVRENIIFLLFFLTLCAFSWTVIGIFIKRKEKDAKEEVQQAPPPADDDESLVYRICFWLCVFSLSIAIGATLLLPISIVSNEVLLIYPNTYYVQWLNGMLIQGLWNLIFLFANISLFILLPFSYLFIESEGFSGHKKGLLGKFYETVVVLILSGFAIWGISHILASVLNPGTRRSLLGGLFNIIGFSNQLPFIYSCISFFGVLLLLLCTPVGTGKLFTVLSQLLVGPQFLRNLEEEHRVKQLEIEALKNRLRRKIEITEKMRKDLKAFYESKKDKARSTTHKSAPRKMANGNHDLSKTNGNGMGGIDISALKKRWDCLSQDGSGDDELDSETMLNNKDPSFVNLYQKMMCLSPQGDTVVEESEDSMRSQLQQMELELIALEKLKKTPGWKRNLLYPLTFLAVLLLTALTVFMAVINTLQLVVGLKELPISAQTVSLGLSSMSVLGPWGAGLEIILIFYLITTSIIGCYSLPGVRRITPRTGETQTSHIIYNCALVLILSSALPLLSRILGITNFDLLGNYGQIEWLGNFYIVFLYNIIFSGACTLCLANQFTSTIRQELLSRLRTAFRFRFLQSDSKRLERERSPLPNGSAAYNTPTKTTPVKTPQKDKDVSANGDKAMGDMGEVLQNEETKKTL